MSYLDVSVRSKSGLDPFTSPCIERYYFRRWLPARHGAAEIGVVRGDPFTPRGAPVEGTPAVTQECLIVDFGPKTAVVGCAAEEHRDLVADDRHGHRIVLVDGLLLFRCSRLPVMEAVEYAAR